MSVRHELLEKYETELRELEMSPPSRTAREPRNRRAWLLGVIADLDRGAMTPIVLEAIRAARSAE